MRRAHRLLFLPFFVLLHAACEPAPRMLFASPQSEPIALSPDGAWVYVANTTSDSLSVIDASTRQEVAEIPVGVEPVSVAVRPDGLEVWVANHVSDSVSIVDANPASASFRSVIETLQDYEPLAQGGATRFDEPVGIAFASNARAYVALSSRDQIAVVDATSYAVTGTLAITAQDPRAIRVRNGRLYVVPFESNNQSELSACGAAGPPGTTQCTFGLQSLLQIATDPNLPDTPKNIVRDPGVPDRDLFVFDAASGAPVGSPVTNVGTLLYGLAVDSQGVVYVANTDARNHDQDGNGLAAPLASGRGLGLGLADLDNRIFHNQITRIDCSGPSCGAPTHWHLEPDLPAQPLAGEALATPYGIQITADDQILVVSAAASSRIATVDASNGNVLARLDVGAIPRGVALRDEGDGTHTAWVLNTLDNSVSAVSVAANGALTLLGTVAGVGSDPTPAALREGRIAFNTAEGSSSGTFACAACHPDAGVDQLLWVIGATCDDCEQEEPRSTMPVRGLRETLPLHWDGTLGDPIGGPNGETGPGGSVAPNCDAADPHGCFLQLVDAALSGVMCDQGGSCAVGPSGLPGRLSETERNDMATFLRSVTYMPPRSRPMTDVVSSSARGGFADFFLDQGGANGGGTSTCADTTGGCHALPLGVSTNSPVVGAFEAPTMRGMTDRFLQFSSGFTAPEEVVNLVFGQGWKATGLDEKLVFDVAFPAAFTPIYNVGPDDMFQMFEEASTGFSGAHGRQVTLNARTASGALRAETEALLVALEDRDVNYAVNLRGVGLMRNGSGQLVPKTLWALETTPPVYVDESNPPRPTTREALFDHAAAGNLIMTFTAGLRMNAGSALSQPLIAPSATGGGATGDPNLPVLPADNPMQLLGVEVQGRTWVLIDGQLVHPNLVNLTCLNGSFGPICSSQQIQLELLDPPTEEGLHLLQLQTEFGLLSNELPFCVGDVAACR